MKQTALRLLMISASTMIILGCIAPRNAESTVSAKPEPTMSEEDKCDYPTYGKFFRHLAAQIDEETRGIGREEIYAFMWSFWRRCPCIRIPGPEKIGRYEGHPSKEFVVGLWLYILEQGPPTAKELGIDTRNTVFAMNPYVDIISYLAEEKEKRAVEIMLRKLKGQVHYLSQFIGYIMGIGSDRDIERLKQLADDSAVPEENRAEIKRLMELCGKKRE